jgi:Rrf2 family protein
MPYGVGVEYALHCLLYLIDPPVDSAVGIKELAEYQGVSETYLSKAFTRLKKAGIVRSTPGPKGGYELARDPEEITFWDVVEALEGDAPLFQCQQVRYRSAPYQGEKQPNWIPGGECTINLVMLEAERRMRDYLREKTLAWLHETLRERLPARQQAATARWFRQALARRA